MKMLQIDLQKADKRYGYWRRISRRSKYISTSNPMIRESNIELLSRELNSFSNCRFTDNLLTNIIYVTVITACICICFFGNFKY